jgi:hypothetical protein
MIGVVFHCSQMPRFDEIWLCVSMYVDLITCCLVEPSWDSDKHFIQVIA